jgi:hypothetical protein
MSEHPHALSALREKRAVLGGELQQAKKRIRELQDHLAIIDGAIRLFDPDSVPETIQPKIKRNRVYPFHIRRTILGVVRRAESPMTAKAIAEKIVTERNMDQTDIRLITDLTRKVRNSLSQNHAGLICGPDDETGVNVWRVDWSGY